MKYYFFERLAVTREREEREFRNQKRVQIASAFLGLIILAYIIATYLIAR